jgi:hypothetical protein
MMEDLDNLKSDILGHRNKIKSIIDSVQNEQHIASCQRMLDNWDSIIERRLDSFKPSFLFKNTTCWRSTLELHLRTRRIYQCLLAEKKAAIYSVYSKDNLHELELV